MAAPRKHDTSLILDAARALVLREGPRAASVAAIAVESGAPVGTLYHRFGNRDGILAAAWLRALERFQERCLQAAGSTKEPIGAGVAMALSIVSFARDMPDDAQLLLSLRRDDLLDAAPGPEFRTRLDTVNEPLESEIRRVATGLNGLDDARTLDAVTRAVVDIPYSAIRRHAGSEVLPGWLEHDVADATRTLLQSI